MRTPRLISMLKQARRIMEEAQDEPEKQYPGVGRYIEKALQDIELALSNLGEVIPKATY